MVSKVIKLHFCLLRLDSEGLDVMRQTISNAIRYIARIERFTRNQQACHGR